MSRAGGTAEGSAPDGGVLDLKPSSLRDRKNSLMQSSGEPPKIRVLTRESCERESYVIEEGKSSVGRSPENTIVLQDSLVSRRHAELDFDGSDVVVRNVGPTSSLFLKRGLQTAAAAAISGTA